MRGLLSLAAGVAVLVLVVFAVSSPAGNPDAGAELAKPCMACHGSDGIASVDKYPSLAGQNEGYLYESMKAYRDGNRRGGQATVMHGQVANFSDQELRDLAAYYAAMPRTGKED